MASNKFTREQFLLLAECEYVLCDNVERLEGILSGKAEDLTKEVIRLSEKAKEIMPDVVEAARETLKVDPRIEPDASNKARAVFIFESEVRSSKRGGLFAIICLYDALKGEKVNGEINN